MTGTGPMAARGRHGRRQLVAGAQRKTATVEVHPFRPLSRTAAAAVERERLAMKRWLAQ
jgi:hypothetical protein